MIKCKIDSNKNYIKLKAKGTPDELAKDAVALIMVSYNNLKNQNPKAANEYKRLIQAAVIDPQSPTFKG